MRATRHRMRVVLAGLLFSSGITSPPSQATQRGPGLVTLPEVEILVYFVPVATQLRAEGMDVGFEEDSTSDNNQKDFYYFYVYNSKRQDAPNATVGHFVVNKHTGNIWNATTFEMVTSKEISGIQKILRRAHNIDQGTIRKHEHDIF